MNTIAGQFETTTVGVNTTTNLINWATGVQIFDSWLGASKAYAVSVPAAARNSGVRVVEIVATLDEAFAAAARIMPAAAAKMARLHAAAHRSNATR